MCIRDRAKPTPAPPAPTPAPATRVTAVTFAPDGDDHVVTIALAGPGATAELVRADGRRAELVVRGASLPADLTKTLDASRFGGPIRTVSSYTDRASGEVRVVVELGRDVPPRLDTRTGAVQLRFAAAAPRVTSQRVPSPVIGGFGATSAPVTQTSVAQLGKRKVYRGATIDLDFKDADIHDLLRALARVGNVNIIVPDEIRASVTVQLKRVPWDQALEVILASKGMWYRKEGNLYRVGDRKVLDVDPRLAARLTDHVEVEVADDGPGMTPEVMRRAFEPFFTTKAAARGMGLSAVYGFVQQCGGHVVLTSAHGQGTAVRLRFPRTVAVPPALVAPSAPARRVLIVDDEPEVRRVLARLLTRDGYHVVEAATADEALALLDAMAFELLITDVVLGAGIDGAALGRAARRQRPDLPIIYVSGYPEDALELKALDARQWFLPKPVALADLRAAVQTALGPAPALA